MLNQRDFADGEEVKPKHTLLYGKALLTKLLGNKIAIQRRIGIFRGSLKEFVMNCVSIVKKYVFCIFSLILLLFFLDKTILQLSARGAGRPEGSVYVYSPQGEDDVSYIQQAAEKQFDFPINILRVDGGGALADRLVAEKGNPQVDAVFGITQLAMEQLKREGVFEKFTPKWAAMLPPAFKDKEGYYYGFWQTPIVLAYNADITRPNQIPKSWLDLIKPEYKDKYTLGGTAAQTARVYLAGMMWRFFDRGSGDMSQAGWDFVEALYQNAMPTPATGEEIYTMLGNGELLLYPHWYGGVVKSAKLIGNYTPGFINTEGGTPVVSESFAITPLGAKNPNALAFIDWFGSVDFQAQMARDLGKAPAIPEALDKAPREIKASMSQFDIQDVNWSKIAPHLNDWMTRIELEFVK